MSKNDLSQIGKKKNIILNESARRGRPSVKKEGVTYKRVGIELTTENHRRLKMLALKADVPMSIFLNEVIENLCDESGLT